MTDILEFYKGKKIFLTGHTGFKGSWLGRILTLLGAKVYGYSMQPPTNPNLYGLLNADEYIESKIGDVADFESMLKYYSNVNPDIVFHLAAQPIVRESYRHPRETYLTNVMGTVNILECVRIKKPLSLVNVTTDKVYYNIEDEKHLYTEIERLDGFDPYSNSKSCSELVTMCYARSFSDQMCPTSTVRAGNVIGGGDFSPDRIIPDCVRAAIRNEKIVIRNPNSIRPYQHVLEPLFAYIKIAMMQAEDLHFSGNYNIGPEENDCVTTRQLVELFCERWGGNLLWDCNSEKGPHEANYLRLDNSYLKKKLKINPIWDIKRAIKETVDWTRNMYLEKDTLSFTDLQIKEYFRERGVVIE